MSLGERLGTAGNAKIEFVRQRPKAGMNLFGKKGNDGKARVSRAFFVTCGQSSEQIRPTNLFVSLALRLHHYAASDVLAADNASSLESVRMNTSLSPPAPCVKLGDVRTVADKLGVSPRTVYRLADAGRMPQPLKLGSLVRWNLSQIDDWVDAGCPDCRKGAAR